MAEYSINNIQKMLDKIKSINVLNYARLKSIEFNNFRNIENGKIEFPNSKIEEYSGTNLPSILGLYGQNGSGKTSVVLAIELFKDLTSGLPLGNKFASCIKYNCNETKIKYEIVVHPRLFENENKDDFKTMTGQILYYEVIVANDINDNPLAVKYEKLSLKQTDLSGNVIVTKQCLIDTSSKSKPFGPRGKYDLLIENKTGITKKLNELKIKCNIQSKSYIFDPSFLDVLCSGLEEYNFEEYIDKYKIYLDYVSLYGEMAKEDVVKVVTNPKTEVEKKISEFVVNCNENINFLRKIDIKNLSIMAINNLSMYGRNYLHVINTSTTGITNMNQTLPLLLWMHVDKGIKSTRYDLNMDSTSSDTEDNFEFIVDGIENLNLVLNKIIPGLMLEVKDLGYIVNQDNINYHQFEVMVNRNGSLIPLKYESDGIRRIISILSLLIASYNEQSFTVVIDEIDSGIFEFMLGELLNIMAEGAKGQLIFTSHNLRPLEVLPPKYLCFTTTNPNNRFIKLQKRGNSNFRDTYFRKIILGNDSESVYSPTDKYEIELAFYEAGVSQAVGKEE